MEFFGDIIAIDGDPIAIARRYNARELRTFLPRLADEARSVGEEMRWRDALPLGCNGRTGGGFGLELAPAPLAGMGYWRDYPLSPMQLRAGAEDSDIAADLSALEAVCPRATDTSAFSIALNLLELLNGLVAYRAQLGAPPPQHPSPVIHPESKRALLWTRIHDAVHGRQSELGEDGRIAFAALVDGARESEARGWRFVPDLPRPWGSEPDSARYIAAGDPNDLTVHRDRRPDPMWTQ